MPVGQAVTATRLRRPPAARGGLRSAAAAAVSPPPAAAAARRPRRGAAAGSGLAERLGDQVDDLLGRLGRAQRVGELGLDQRAGQLGEQLEVGGVAAGRGGDQEGQVGRAVLGAEVDRRGEPREGERRLLDPGGAAVRDRDAAGQPGGARWPRGRTRPR